MEKRARTVRRPPLRVLGQERVRVLVECSRMVTNDCLQHPLKPQIPTATSQRAANFPLPAAKSLPSNLQESIPIPARSRIIINQLHPCTSAQCISVSGLQAPVSNLVQLWTEIDKNHDTTKGGCRLLLHGLPS
jgi:hypothetical protein